MASRRVPADPDSGIPAYPSLGRRIEEGIKRSGLSKSEVARRLGTSYVTVHRWTTGESKLTIPFLRLLPGVIGMTLDEILAIAEGQDPPFASWRSFLETAEGQGMSPMERRALQAIAWPPGMEPTLSSYLVILSGIRSAQTRDD